MALSTNFSGTIPTMLQNAPVGILVTDGQNKIVWINETLRHYLDIDFKKVAGATSASLKNNSLRALLEAKNIAELPATAIYERRWTKCWRTPIADSEEGATAHYFFDVTELHQLNSENQLLKNKLEKLDTQDKTTGMLNHHGLMQTLESQVSRSRRYNNPLSLIIIEVGGLNDEESLAQAMVTISRLLNDQLRWADLAGCLNNNRFLLILPETSQSDTAALAKKLTQQIETLDECPDDLTIRSANSSWKKGDDLDKLMGRAQKGLN